MERYFILIDKKPGQVFTIQKYADWEKTANTNVAFTQLVGGIKISTEFTGLDFNWSATPLLFETMIFGGKMTALPNAMLPGKKRKEGLQRRLQSLFKF
jgi:hypothetical protein